MTPETHGLTQATLHHIKLLALGLVQRGDFDNAERLFQALHILEPEDVYTLNALGVLALERADSRQALRMFLRARRAAPTSLQVHVNLGEAYLRAGQVERALDCFGQLLDGNLGKFAPGDPTLRRARVLAAAAGHTLRKAAAEAAVGAPNRPAAQLAAVPGATRILRRK